MHFPPSKTSFLLLAYEKASWKLETKYVAISKCFLLHHTGFFCSAGFAGGQQAVHACNCVEAGAIFIREVSCDTCKGIKEHKGLPSQAPGFMSQHSCAH